MTGQLYLGNHLYETFAGIGHHLFYLLLSEITLMNRSVLLVPYRTYARQLGIFLYLHSP